MRVLIVEDQEKLAKMVKDGLESEGFAADYVTDGETGSRRLLTHYEDYDLVILDVMMPKKDGIQVCREARKEGVTIPILMLTAKDGVEDVVLGLDVGADDYLAKPFSFEVLLARIRALLRRPKTTLPPIITLGTITIKPESKEVFKSGTVLPLTLKEFSLLEYFMRNPDRAFDREQIISHAWDFEFDSFSNVVDVHITNLRKKLGDKDGNIIETVRGVGYKFNSKNA